MDARSHRSPPGTEAAASIARVERHALPPEPQLGAAVVMVRPACFGANPETAASNAFQAPHDERELAEIRRRARRELDGFVGALQARGARVLLLEDELERRAPDAVFPNNWVTLHRDGTAILYPMQAASRRREVRFDLFERLESEGLFTLRRLLDLRPLAEQGEFLEGTGSLVLDRPRRLAYACLSPRTTQAALGAFAAATGWEVHAFRATDERGLAVYHTNVMLALGEGFAAVCLEALPDSAERAALRARLCEGRELLELTREQMTGFAANLLALRGAAGEPLVALSEKALSSFTPAQRARLEAHGALATAPLPTLELHGGGSACCTLLEVPLEVRN